MIVSERSKMRHSNTKIAKAKKVLRDHDTPGRNLKRKEYEAELAKLHVEVVRLQECVKSTGAKICIVFEGRDGAGKGGTIKAITERVRAPAYSVSSPCRLRPTAKNLRCICSAMCRTCRQPGKS